MSIFELLNEKIRGFEPIAQSNNDEPIQIEDNFISELNRDLELEWASAIQYVQHASMMTGTEHASIIPDLLIHADEEIAHAKILAERISYLGGVVSTGVDEIKTSNDDTEKLMFDYNDENEAIGRYKERIRQAIERGDEGTAHILGEILVDEEHHADDIKTHLGL